jgi:hypothetical protein
VPQQRGASSMLAPPAYTLFHHAAASYGDSTAWQQGHRCVHPPVHARRHQKKKSKKRAAAANKGRVAGNNNAVAAGGPTKRGGS